MGVRRRGRGQRQPRGHLIATGRARACLHPAAVDGHPLAHPGQPVAGPVGGGRAAPPVVGDPQQQRVLQVAQRHLGGGPGPAVLAGVGERLLHDPVGGQRRAVRQRLRHTLDGEGDRQARGPGLFEQLAELADAGQRGAFRLGAVFVPPQHAQHAPHLRQRLPAGGGDRGQRLLGAVRVGAQRVGGAVRLDHHDADVVGDHVVELAGDPGPLRRRGDLRLRVALGLQPGRPVLQAGVVRPPVAHRVAEHPRDQRRAGEHDRADRYRVQHAELARHPPGHRRRRAHQADGEAGDRDPPRRVGGEGVQQDDDRQVGGVGLDVQQDLERRR